jgi:uncharacterized coiled-coil protein SlyX
MSDVYEFEGNTAKQATEESTVEMETSSRSDTDSLTRRINNLEMTVLAVALVLGIGLGWVWWNARGLEQTVASQKALIETLGSTVASYQAELSGLSGRLATAEQGLGTVEQLRGETAAVAKEFESIRTGVDVLAGNMKAVSEQLNRHSDIFTRDAEANKQLIEALQQHLQLRQSILETVN